MQAVNSVKERMPELKDRLVPLPLVVQSDTYGTDVGDPLHVEDVWVRYKEEEEEEEEPQPPWDSWDDWDFRAWMEKRRQAEVWHQDFLRRQDLVGCSLLRICLPCLFPYCARIGVAVPPDCSNHNIGQVFALAPPFPPLRPVSCSANPMQHNLQPVMSAVRTMGARVPALSAPLRASRSHASVALSQVVCYQTCALQPFLYTCLAQMVAPFVSARLQNDSLRALDLGAGVR